MDAKTLYNQGVAAIRDRKDKEEGRRLLTQSLRLDPNNERAWLWLSRTITDPQKALRCVERALNINPTNPAAKKLQQHYRTQLTGGGAGTVTTGAVSLGALATSKRPKTTRAEHKKIDLLMSRAQKLMDVGRTEDAIAQWVSVLDIRPDHEIALREAVRNLMKLKYADDAKELVNRAIAAGSTAPSIYLTAIDFAKRDQNPNRVDELRMALVQLPKADDELISRVVDDYMRVGDHGPATDILELAIHAHPESQKLLFRMGKLHEEMGRDEEAMQYFNKAAKRGGSKEGREADKMLQNYRPVLTDRERGSTSLAWREAAGFGVVFLMMGFQDAGLNFLSMGARWAGVILSIIGGYLIVTATSSPQQQPLASWLGGQVPPKKKQALPEEVQRGQAFQEPTELPILSVYTRAVFGVIGGVLLIIAFWLVFSTALGLLSNPKDFFLPSWDLIFDESVLLP